MSKIRIPAARIACRVDPASLVLILAAIWFLTLGTPMVDVKDDALAFSLVGAAVTRMVDVLGERRRERIAEADRRAKDLDETRRLLYGILTLQAAPTHGHLIATAANALAHHGVGIPVSESLPNLTAVANGGGATEHEQWLLALIAEITTMLDDQTHGKG